MLIQFVRLETTLNEDELDAVMKERLPEYRTTPGLLQKYYVKMAEPNHYGGIMVWENRESLEAFRQTDLAKTVGAVYSVKGAPSVEIIEVMFPLRDMPELEGAVAAAR